MQTTICVPGTANITLDPKVNDSEILCPKSTPVKIRSEDTLQFPREQQQQMTSYIPVWINHIKHR